MLQTFSLAGDSARLDLPSSKIAFTQLRVPFAFVIANPLKFRKGFTWTTVCRSWQEMSQAIGHLQKDVQSGSLLPEDVDSRAFGARSHTAVSGLLNHNPHKMLSGQPPHLCIYHFIVKLQDFQILITACPC